MKINTFKFNEEFVKRYSVGDPNIKWVNFDINKKIEEADVASILDLLFVQFYYVQSHYLREKRQDIVTFLLKHKLVFEKAENYQSFLVMIFIHLVIIDERADIIEQLISVLNEYYGENLRVEQPDFTKNAFLQYCAAYYHKHYKNEEACHLLEFIDHIQHNNDFLATNFFLLTTAYISSGRHRDAFIACQKASQYSLETGNYIRYFYCEMNHARICSSMGDFLNAIDIYQECLNGCETIAPQSRNYLIENIATNYMYLREYRKAIDLIEQIETSKLNNNAAYICALSYWELGNRSKATEWVEIGKNAIYAHKTAELFIQFVETLLTSDDGEKLIDCLGEMNIYEQSTENYATYNYVTRRLIKQFAKMGYYKEAYEYAEDFFKL